RLPERKISADVEEAYRRLHELFGGNSSTPPKRGCRKYVLECQDGKPIFRDANSGLLIPRSELELMVDQIFDEILNNDIVPQKFANCFTGSRFEPGRY